MWLYGIPYKTWTFVLRESTANLFIYQILFAQYKMYKKKIKFKNNTQFVLN